MAEEKTRILIPDKNQSWREVLSIATRRHSGEINLYFFFPKKFNKLIGKGEIEFKDFTGDRSSNADLDFHELHLRYPPDGSAHFSVKDGQGNPIVKRTFYKHQPLSAVSSVKLILSVLPKSLDHYPVCKDPNEKLDLKLENSAIPNFFANAPLSLNFWIGNGSRDSLPAKSSGVANFEMLKVKQYVQVFAGQEENDSLQLFMAVSKRQDTNEFPAFMSLFLHSEDSPSLVKKR